MAAVDPETDWVPPVVGYPPLPNPTLPLAPAQVGVAVGVRVGVGVIVLVGVAVTVGEGVRVAVGGPAELQV